MCLEFYASGHLAGDLAGDKFDASGDVIDSRAGEDRGGGTGTCRDWCLWTVSYRLEQFLSGVELVGWMYWSLDGEGERERDGANEGGS
jgi:hypothetical protein